MTVESSELSMKARPAGIVGLDRRHLLHSLDPRERELAVEKLPKIHTTTRDYISGRMAVRGKKEANR